MTYLNYAKKIILLLALITLMNFSSAVKISPTKQTLSMSQGDTNCTDIWVLPKSDFAINDKWAVDGQGNLSKYKLTNEEIKLLIEHRHFSDGKYEFCFTPKKAGNFSGLILFYSARDLTEIGTWIELQVNKTSFSEDAKEKLFLITGNIIGTTGRNYFLAFLFIMVFLLLIILIFLIIKL